MTGVRLRFFTEADLCLLREVINVNPYKNPEDWKLIQDNVVRSTNKNFSLRALKDHLEHLLKLFVKNDKTHLRKSGTEEEYNEKERLLQEIIDLRREYQGQQVIARKSYKRSNSVSDKENRQRGIEMRRGATECLAIVVNDNETGQQDIQDNADELSEVFTFQAETQQNIEMEGDHPTNNVVQAETPRTAVLRPTRQRRKRKATSDAALTFLKDKNAAERELDIEERKVALEESRLNLEREDREQRRKLEAEELRFRINVNEQQQNTIQCLLKVIVDKVQNRGGSQD